MQMFYKFEIYIVELIWKQVYYDSLKLSFFSVHDINNKRMKTGVFTNHVANEWDSSVQSVQIAMA